MKKEFIVQNKLDEKDFKTFMYISTFFKSMKKLIITAILFAAFVYLAIKDEPGNMAINFTKYYLILLVFFVIALIAHIEMRYRTRIRTDKSGMFEENPELIFTDKCLKVKSEAFKSEGEITYEMFYKLIETKDYFYFYFNEHQATIVNKKLIDDYDNFRIFIHSKFKKNYKYINV